MSRVNKKTIGIAAVAVLLAVAASASVYKIWLEPTNILVLNARDSQAADMALNNDCRRIKISFLDDMYLENLDGIDALIVMRGGKALTDEAISIMSAARDRGCLVYINYNADMEANSAFTEEDYNQLSGYFTNPCRQNYRNGFRFMRHLHKPRAMKAEDYESPFILPDKMYYHREYGCYFETQEELTDYLKKKGIYNEGGINLAYIAGKNFPMEGNRPHVDTLISILTAKGYNVYPFVGSGKERELMIKRLRPDAVIYTPMGRVGSDSFVQWLGKENILLFNPYPLNQTHEDWLNPLVPVSGGTLNVRVVVPEIDGGIGQYCLATNNETEYGYFQYTAEMERVRSFVEHLDRYMRLRSLPNKDKKVAICFFKLPGKDALIASGMEVIPSIYNLLVRLRSEGYDVSGLPASVEQFGKMIRSEGSVMGSYAKGAQEEFMRTAHPVWLSRKQYESWTRETLTPEKFDEIEQRYGAAPGNLLSRGDSLAVACLRIGNILIFPQPRPALGDDDFKLVHGAKVAPPHSYIAPYLYVKKGFQADALIHFGTHGNLEFTPGNAIAQSQADWSDVLTGNLPHFYYYTTGNVGEAVIAKRRTHAVSVTYLTAPFVESGMRRQFRDIDSQLHRALDQNDLQASLYVKRKVVELGINRDLDIDSTLTTPYDTETLEKLDDFIEELMNEKITGAFYTLGKPYSKDELQNTVLAMSADQLAYDMAVKEGSKDSKRYLQEATRQIKEVLDNPSVKADNLQGELQNALHYKQGLLKSTVNELDAMVNALNGGAVLPAPGGDPVLSPNVLPTGRNMYSINAEATPSERAWEEGSALAEETINQYKKKHGEYPRKVSYTFWAGEFINSEGATIAQVIRMLGLEPVRDRMGHVVDYRLIPDSELGRPRIDIVVQASGQLRDIASSRLMMIASAVRMASEAPAGEYPNYVAEGTLAQEKSLLDAGFSPQRAREMSTMRVFGPVNSGYSTGMLGRIEHSGDWEDKSEIVDTYLQNMGAAYGDQENWGSYESGLLAAALDRTDALVQPRQSNTWGAVSLDHVYEFTGSMSLAVTTLTGKEPDAYMADYRRRSRWRLQNAGEAVAVELRSTLLNPQFIKERMKGGEGTAENFGELFRNVFGWNVTRPSIVDEKLYDNLYDTYILDCNKLGIHSYLENVNPAAFQAITSVMMESARKGYWKATPQQLETTAALHAEVVKKSGAACTEFVCDNAKLQQFISNQLDASAKSSYDNIMGQMRNSSSTDVGNVVLKQHKVSQMRNSGDKANVWLVIAAVVMIAVLLLGVVRKRRNQE